MLPNGSSRKLPSPPFANKIGVDSPGLGRGSEFYVTIHLPLVDADSKEVRGLESAGASMLRNMSAYSYGPVSMSASTCDERSSVVSLPSLGVKRKSTSLLTAMGKGPVSTPSTVAPTPPASSQASPHGLPLLSDEERAQSREADMPLGEQGEVGPAAGRPLATLHEEPTPSLPLPPLQGEGEGVKERDEKKGNLEKEREGEADVQQVKEGLEAGLEGMPKPTHSATAEAPRQEYGEGERGYTADVLIVDDNDICVMAIEMVVRRAGRTYRVSHDCLEAVDRMVNREERYPLILVDRDMPRCSGPSAVQTIHSHLLSISPDEADRCTFIGLTGMAVPEARKEFIDAGAREVFDKPIHRNMVGSYVYIILYLCIYVCV
jgi:CheY-like chemotaxis protein